MVGVDPADQGRGLGPAADPRRAALACAQRGLACVLLYVDESNTAAAALYQRLGFHRTTTDVCWER